MALNIDPGIKTRFPDLMVLTHLIIGLKVRGEATTWRSLKQVREQYYLESLKDLPTFRAYRDFFWRVGIDPTKSRPAAEARIRRILAGKTII